MTSEKLQKNNSRLLGAAAEHFVMSELLRRDFIAALAPAGVPDVDIIVSDGEGQSLFAVQVKARRMIGSDGGWHMKKKHDNLSRNTLFYCFVEFGDTGVATRCWILPSHVVADTIRRSYAAWLEAPGKSGQAHNASDLRRMLPHYKEGGMSDRKLGWMDQYLDAWSLLGHQTTA